MRRTGARNIGGPAAAVAAVATALLVLGCGLDAPNPTVSPSASPDQGVTPSPDVAPPTTPSAGSVLVDPRLLDLLPATIDDVARIDDPDTGAEIAGELAGDAGLADDIEAVGVALYAGAADYAVVTVTRLRPGRFDDAYFRDWRDTFDAAVCDQAGGVDGRAEAPIAGRTAYIGTCAGGVRTYHVHLSGPERLVSLQALGEGRFGERILGGLTE
ncbi:MAG: hypothetical protein ACLGIJ_03730 [Candidatus Limnocylindria bacterium]